MEMKLDKFDVVHHVRGRLPPGDAFVLVPKRDPAAVVAIRAYADATPDAELAAELRTWLEDVDGLAAVEREGITRPRGNVVGFATQVAVWTATLAREVREGGMLLETALQRIAGHAWTAGRRTVREARDAG